MLADDQISLLLIEDDPKVVAGARSTLRPVLHRFEHAAHLRAARAILRGGSAFDIILLDVQLPDGNGFEFATALRAAGDRTPIIMITARDAVSDRVRGLEIGADDYLCKPFDVAELKARIDAVLRRAVPTAVEVLRYDDVEVHVLKRELRRGRIRRALSLRELDLLIYYMRNANRVLEKRAILREVWGDDVEQDDNLLQVYTNYLRNKLECGGDPRLIHTIRGVGYVFSTQEPE